MSIRATNLGLTCLAVFSLALLSAGCEEAATGNSSTTTGLATPSSPVGEVTTTIERPIEVVDEAGYGAATVVTGLRIPWEMRFMPDGRLLVTEREGGVVIADVGTGRVTRVGHIEALARGEGGLMGLAIDPAFPDPPRIYVSYTTSAGGDVHNRVSSFELSGWQSDSPALGVETVLLDGIPAGNIHNGSRVAFGPDGNLWVTTGDTGRGELAQRMDSLAGKVLRMTSDGRTAPGNPFPDRPYPFSLIYTLGHRNLQGLAFHPDSGKAYVTEHGPSDNDEVNILQPGGNYAWPARGILGRTGLVDPIRTWTPTIAPAGALFGSTAAGLQGMFVFVTLKQSDIRVLTPADEAFTAVAGEQVLFDGEFGRLRAIALGPDGALYVATSNHDGRGDPRDGDDRIIRIVQTD